MQYSACTPVAPVAHLPPSPGIVVTAPCPRDSEGQAVRECGATGWERPQLARWLQQLTAGYRNGGTVSHLATFLRSKIATESLYGGDIISLFDLIESSVRNFQFHTSRDENTINIQVLHDYLHVLSNLLEPQMIPAWMDMAPIELEFQRTRFIGLLQELGVVALGTSNLETAVQSPNFGKQKKYKCLAYPSN